MKIFKNPQNVSPLTLHLDVMAMPKCYIKAWISYSQIFGLISLCAGNKQFKGGLCSGKHSWGWGACSKPTSRSKNTICTSEVLHQNCSHSPERQRARQHSPGQSQEPGMQRSLRVFFRSSSVTKHSFWCLFWFATRCPMSAFYPFAQPKEGQ